MVLPKTVKIKHSKNFVFIKGKKSITQLDKTSLSTAKLRSSLIGESVGYSVRLVFNGVGYRVESLTDQTIKIKLGFSHFVFVNLPEEITAVSPKKTNLVLSSANLFALKSFVSKIRQIGPVDCYKGKGILIKNEIIRLKEGKKK